jgi:Polysaccharide pyruvyl transferase
MTRRRFLQAAVASSLVVPLRGADELRRPRILLRSSWQTVNIGDIGHTPGMLAVLEKHLPEAEVRLWPSKVDNGVKEILRARFPKLVIVEGAEALKAAFAECDFLLHGSGPSLVAEKDLVRWRAETGKPYGVGGITFTWTTPETIGVLNGARFVFFRDSVSLQTAKERGCSAPIIEFGPDGAFGVDLRNDAAALAFLKAHDLEEGGFFCCIPRLRKTPYWKIHRKPMTAADGKNHARNEAMKERDHAPLREAIIVLTRRTRMKVLLCPEDQSQMAIGKELLFDPLPDDVHLHPKRGAFWK